MRNTGAQRNRLKADRFGDRCVGCPDIMHSFTSGIIKYLGTEPMIVSSQTDTGVRVVTENPTRTGPDRIVNAAAGYAIAGGPAIVVDFGTATTYDLIGPECSLKHV